MELKEVRQGTYCNKCKCEIEPIYSLNLRKSVCVKCSSDDIEPLMKKFVDIDDLNVSRMYDEFKKPVWGINLNKHPKELTEALYGNSPNTEGVKKNV